MLTDDERPASWPEADVIVGNPPFLGDKAMISVLGAEYTSALRHAFAGRVPGGADLVCYWFERAWDATDSGRTKRVGLVATNSIRGGANRRLLDPIAQAGAISTAWGDEPWELDGASVRVSLVCWGRDRAALPMLDGKPVSTIYADLTAGGSNLTMARALEENVGYLFIGTMKKASFDVSGEEARIWSTER